MKPKELLKELHKLPASEQNEIRKGYKRSHKKEYDYSIRLFILYTFIGIVGLLGLFIGFYYGEVKGFYIYFFSILFLVLCVVLLRQSNEPFYKYLKNQLKKKD